MKIRGPLLLLAFAAAFAVGIVALASPAEAGPPCYIRCALGVCEKCCVQKGGWVCNPA
jgi:hypothetical protein